MVVALKVYGILIIKFITQVSPSPNEHNFFQFGVVNSRKGNYISITSFQIDTPMLYLYVRTTHN